MIPSTSKAVIRTAVASDTSALAALSAELGYPDAADGLEERLASALASSEHAVLVATLSNGEVAGWIHVFSALRVESQRFAELGGFVVAAAYRRCGLGRRLLDAAEAWARDRGFSRLRVRSRLERTDAKAFYERMGFAETKVQRAMDKPLDTPG